MYCPQFFYNCYAIYWREATTIIFHIHTRIYTNAYLRVFKSIEIFGVKLWKYVTQKLRYENFCMIWELHIFTCICMCIWVCACVKQNNSIVIIPPTKARINDFHCFFLLCFLLRSVVSLTGTCVTSVKHQAAAPHGHIDLSVMAAVEVMPFQMCEIDIPSAS